MVLAARRRGRSFCCHLAFNENENDITHHPTTITRHPTTITQHLPPNNRRPTTSTHRRNHPHPIRRVARRGLLSRPDSHSCKREDRAALRPLGRIRLQHHHPLHQNPQHQLQVGRGGLRLCTERAGENRC